MSEITLVLLEIKVANIILLPNIIIKYYCLTVVRGTFSLYALIIYFYFQKHNSLTFCKDETKALYCKMLFSRGKKIVY